MAQLRASFAPELGLNTIIFKHVYWYMQQISGERLQDHWSSGWFSAHLGFVNVAGIAINQSAIKARQLCYKLCHEKMV